MARDLDFRPIKRRVPNTPAPTNHTTQKTVARPERKPSYWPLILLIVGLGLASVALFAYYSEQISGSITAPPVDTAASSSDQPSSSGNGTSVFDQAEKLVIQLYDSGAGSEVMASTVKSLEDAGYTVEQLGTSQFEYDKTYIWHQPTRTTDAQAIGSILSNREISYRESQIKDVFDVLIYLGKK